MPAKGSQAGRPPPAADIVVTAGKVTDLIPDDKNANKGTVRGTALIEDSLSEFGGGRSILIDRNGKILAGNKTIEGAVNVGLDDLIIVESDGTKIIAVKRTDIDLNTPRGRKLALMDNRTNEVSLEWDSEVLRDLQAEEVDLSRLWSDGELSIILEDYAGQGLDGDIALKSQYQNMDYRESTQIRIEFGEINTNLSPALYDRLLARLKTYPGYRDGLIACFENFLDA